MDSAPKKANGCFGSASAKKKNGLPGSNTPSGAPPPKRPFKTPLRAHLRKHTKTPPPPNKDFATAIRLKWWQKRELTCASSTLSSLAHPIARNSQRSLL